jgi:uncharacterized protein YerC
MQVSEKKLDKNLEKQIFQIFYQTIADLKTLEEVKSFFKDFLSEAARVALAKKLAIAVFLDKNYSYKEIKKTLAVSSSTVAEIDRQLSRRGFRLALKKIKADEWAEKWSIKIGGALQKLLLRK